MPFSVEVAVAAKLQAELHRASFPTSILGAGPDIGCRILLETTSDRNARST
jgi:hypothetical protein